MNRNSTLLAAAMLLAAVSHSNSQIQIVNLPTPFYVQNFESLAEGALPAGWNVTNATTVDAPGFDFCNPRSDAYLDFVVIDGLQRLCGAACSFQRNATNMNPIILNGVPLDYPFQGQLLWAESDNRSGSQVNVCFTGDIDCSGQSNVVVAWKSVYMQNQDSIGAVEYSVDQGVTWLPVIYYLDDQNRAADIIRTNGVIDVRATFGTARADQAYSLAYSNFICAPVSIALLPHIAGRVNDDAYSGKRVEIIRLFAADGERNVRFRFVQAGTRSWYFGIDDFGLYSISSPIITQQPQDQVKAVGEMCEFTVVATGTGPLRYQWDDDCDGTGDEFCAIPGATGDTYTIAQVTAQAARAYRVRVSNGSGSVTSQVATLTVLVPNQPPALSDIPNQTLQQNTSTGPIPFTVGDAETPASSLTVSGSSSNPTLVPNANIVFGGIGANRTVTVTLANNQTGTATITVTVSDGSGGTATDTFVVTATDLPVITQQPQSLTVIEGETATFSVTATGSEPLTYEWETSDDDNDGVDPEFHEVPGATNASYVLTAEETDDGSLYRVRVGNAFGAVTSQVARLTVSVAPEITRQPQSQSVNEGHDATFTVTATGTQPMNFEWQFRPTGGSTFSLKARCFPCTNEPLTLANARLSDAGDYRVVIANASGAVTSQVATLTVRASLTINCGQNETLMAGFSWDFAVPIITDACDPNPTLTIVSTVTNAGVCPTNFVATRVWRVTDLCGQSVTCTQIVTIVSSCAPVILSQPQSLTVEEGETATFTVLAMGHEPLTYQWLSVCDCDDDNDGVDDFYEIPGATNSSYTWLGEEEDLDRIQVRVSNAYGAVTSQVATLTVLGAPIITRQPQSQAVSEGADVRLTATATGAQPMSFEWQFRPTGGSNFLSFRPCFPCTNEPLAISSARLADMGDYRVVISNAFGAVTSAVATLTVQCTLRPGFNTFPLLANDDGSAGPVSLGFSNRICFCGGAYTTLYVNNNGNVTFGTGLASYTPSTLSALNLPIIAPFWADVDTRGTGSDVTRYGYGTVGGRPAFGVTWKGVGYYDSHADLLNDFQLIIIDRSDIAPGDFDFEFRYEHVRWETGDASGGSGGFGGTSARAGYANGAQCSFELPGSGVNYSFEDFNSATGLIHHSLGTSMPGCYLFCVRDCVVTNCGTNLPPVADAGFPVGVCADANCNGTVKLDGSASYDPDGDPLTYTWTENGVTIGTGPMPTVTLNGAGIHTITLCVDDGHGHMSYDTVTIAVVDKTPPVVRWPSGIICLPVDDHCLACIPAITPPASDNCGPLTYSQNPVPFTKVSPGFYSVTVTVTDAAGNSSACVVHVQAKDVTPPVIVTCPPDTNVVCCEARIPKLTDQIVAIDNCTPQNLLSISQTPAPGTYVGPGVYCIVITVCDQAGNCVSKKVLFTVIGSVQPILLYNTGVDNNNAPLAACAVDPHYAIVASTATGYPAGNAIVVNNATWPLGAGGPWLPDTPASQWIAPACDGAQGSGNVGVYTYQTTFSLAGLNAASATIMGRWSTDNGGYVQLNGSSVPVSTTGNNAYGQWLPFTVSAGFVPTLNTLNFVVTNLGGPTGLRVELMGMADCDTNRCVPPVIVTQPQDLKRAFFKPATFTCTAAGTPPLSYQWCFNNVPLVNGTMVQGANSPTLTLLPPLFGKAGLYTCKVANECGTAVSRAARLRVTIFWGSLRNQIDFDDPTEPLRATIGEDLQYLDGASGQTAAQTEFGTTTDFGIPDIDGQPVHVMKFPAADRMMGYILRHGAGPNGGLSNQVAQYTFLADVLFPESSSGRSRAMLQTDDDNDGVGDVFVTAADGLGTTAQSFGRVPANTWVRLAAAVDLAAARPSVAFFINGVKVGEIFSQDPLGSGFAVNATNHSAPFLLLFTDGLGQTAAGYVNSLQFHDARLSDLQIAALGAPQADGLPTVDPFQETPTEYFAGLLHVPLGDASVNVESNRLVVGNLGPGVTDGVCILLGEADGWQGHFAGTLDAAALPSGVVQRTVIRGTVNGVADQPVLFSRIEDVGDTLEVSVDFSAVGAETQTIDVFNGGRLVASVPGHTGPAYHVAQMGDTDNDEVTEEPVDSGPCYLRCGLNLTKCCGNFAVPIEIRIVDGPTVIGDRVVISTENQQAAVSALAQVRVQMGGSVPSFALTGEELGAFGLLHRALGGSLLDASGGALRVANIGPGGTDGVSIALGGAPGFSMELDPINLGVVGAAVEVRSHGDFGSNAHALLGTAALQNNGLGSVDLHADFTPLGARRVLVCMFLDGTNAGSITLPAGRVGGLRDDVRLRGCGRLTTGPNRPAGTRLAFARPVVFTPTDHSADFIGNELYCLAVDAREEVSRLTEFRLTGANLGGVVTVRNEDTNAVVSPPLSGIAPIVDITSPTNGQVFASPATIRVEARALDVDGAIRRVRFFEGKNLIGETTHAPFFIVWSGVASNNYVLTAEAEDLDDFVAWSPGVTITVGPAGNHPPVACFTVTPSFMSPNPPDLTVVVTNGDSASVTLDASCTTDADDDADGLSDEWFLDGSPTPFSTNAVTSVTLGLGRHGITLCVMDGSDDDCDGVVVDVIRYGGPLVIARQPQSQRVIEGSNVTFSVTVTGGTGTVRYQWRHNGTPVAGATNPTHTVEYVQPGDWGPYDVVVSDGAGQSITSAPAVLTVVGPPVGFTRTGGGLVLIWPNDTYKLQQSDRVTDGWTDVPSATSPHPVTPGGPGQFYRTQRR